MYEQSRRSVEKRKESRIAHHVSEGQSTLYLCSALQELDLEGQ